MPKSRGRPREYDPQLALDAAMAVFWERGFSGTSLTDLSTAMGMNRPSLYAAFGDKRALFHRALEHYEAHMRETLGVPLMEQPDLRLGLTEFFFAAIDMYLSGDPGHRGCMVVSTASMETASDDEAREVLHRTIGRLDGLLGERFARAAQDGQLSCEDASGRGSVASAILHSMSVRARAGHSRRTLRKFARDSIELLVRSDAS